MDIASVGIDFAAAASKATLTAAVVALVMMAARLFGSRVAGGLAGLPVVTAPALLWIAAEQGNTFAAHAAVGSLAACAGAPLFALAFLVLARRGAAWPALLGGLVVLALASLALAPLAGLPWVMLAAAALACVVVLHQVRPQPVVAVARSRVGEPWLTALTAGLISAVVSALAPRLGAHGAGLLATLPIISACAMVHLQSSGQGAAIAGFVRGYVVGIAAKSAFVFVFALALAGLGAATALVLALAAGAAAGVLLTRQKPLRPAVLPTPMR